jgi:hypothetical protein
MNCESCEHYDADVDKEPCDSCGYEHGIYENFVPKVSVGLESINAKLDAIMDHFGIKR